MKLFKKIQSWFVDLFRVWRREFKLVLSDIGVMLFFFALPTLYPVVYTLIYNPELVKDIPIVVIDDSRTSESRQLTRMVDATDAIKVYDYASNLNDARRVMNNHDCFGILHIPAEYGKKLGRGEQTVVSFYSDVSLLLRYRAFLSALTDVQLQTGTNIQTEKIEKAGLIGQLVSGTPINSESIMIGDPTQGFASFVIPGIIILILQQSLVLGVAMLQGGARERRKRNGGVDPLAVPASPAITLIGKTLCYLTLYLPLTLYILHIVPVVFALPHLGNIWHYLIFVLPMLIASSFMGMSIGAFVSDRESSMLVVVFTSVVFLFLSGLTWPRYAMNGFWTLVGDMIPATWGVEGFIRMNSNHATLFQNSTPYLALWSLAALYFVVALILAYVNRGQMLKNGASAYKSMR